MGNKICCRNDWSGLATEHESGSERPNIGQTRVIINQVNELSVICS